MNFAKSLLLPAVLLLALPALAKETEVNEREYAVPKCNKPVAKIMFTEFKCKSSECYGGGGQSAGNSSWWNPGHVSTPNYGAIGSGLGEMLGTALSQTGCFEVLERAALDEVRKELEINGVKLETDTADYIVTGSITSIGFEQSATGVGALVGKWVPALGGAEFKKTKAHLNLDLRIVDAKRAKIVASKTFQGNNEKTGFGLGGAAFVGIGVLGGNHASISGTPLEEVARDVLVRSTSFVADQLAGDRVVERVVAKSN